MSKKPRRLNQHKEKREQSEINRYKTEIKLLKQQLARERKLRRKLEDGQAFSMIDELEEITEREERGFDQQVTRQEIEKDWKCYECDQGTLVIYTVCRPDGEFYLRKCNCCKNKTKLQKYHPGVRGIFFDQKD